MPFADRGGGSIFGVKSSGIVAVETLVIGYLENRKYHMKLRFIKREFSWILTILLAIGA